jgi:fermentation-respiration switch protein FrsA (DUF1100 family)
MAVALAVATAVAPAMAQEAKQDVAGVWAGKLKVTPQVELTLVLNVEKQPNGTLKATLDSPDQGANDIPIDTITVEGDTLTFESKKIRGTFTGKRSKDGKEFAGQWSQGPSKLPLTLAMVDPKSLTGPEAPKELAGLWEGALDIGGSKLRLVLRVEQPKGKDKLVAYLDSPDQGAKGIAVTAIALKDDQLTFENKAIGGSYKGKLDRKKAEIVGTWSQGGMNMPLTLKKTDKVSEARRPQHPKPPFPYRVEEVTYRNEPASITLAGTLTLPRGDGPFPAVLLITGSGAQDRDETIFGHKPFLVLADALTRRGIAVLRADDRGVGGSGGSMATATSEDFAGDASAGVAFLKSRPEINPRVIGLAGHSEGGLIAPMVAARSGDVAFIVMLAGTGLTGEDILLRQNELIMKAQKASEGLIAAQVETLRRLIEVVKAEGDEKAAVERLEAVLKEIREDSSGKLPKEFQEAIGPGSGIAALVKPLNSPWFRFFLTYDPRPTLQKVKCPVLAINGENDLQVPSKVNLAEIEQALKAGGNAHYTVEELPGLNHLFQHSKTGSPTEYGAIEETFAPEALERVGSWILEQTTGNQP